MQSSAIGFPARTELFTGFQSIKGAKISPAGKGTAFNFFFGRNPNRNLITLLLRVTL